MLSQHKDYENESIRLSFFIRLFTFDLSVFTSSIAVAHGRDTRTRSLSGNRLLSVDTKAEVTLLKYISNFRVAGRSADSLTAAC